MEQGQEKDPAGGPEGCVDRRTDGGGNLLRRDSGEYSQMLKLPDGTVKVLVEGAGVPALSG